MSAEFAPEHVCYVHCSLCNSILVVNVPCNNLFNIVTVRCGLCSTLLSVNLGVLLQTLPLQDLEDRRSEGYGIGCGPSSKRCKLSVDDDPPRHPSLLPPEKRQRAPSAYNRFIKEEIQRIKASNPDITHREAFSAAAKNWAHFPRIHLDNGDQHKLQDTMAVQGIQK